MDVSDVAEPIGKAQGGFYEIFNANAKVGGKWLGVPHGITGNAVAYRRSWHEEVGVKEFPKTWDAWREAGKKLKAKGKPIGQALGHSFGDPPTFAYPLLWSFGGAETDPTGKKVVLNAKGAVDSVKFMQAFWKDACDEGGVAWDDTNNNRAFHAGEISATLNGASIYIVAKRQKDKLKDEKGQPLYLDIEHGAPLPAGPAGQFALFLPFQHSLMNYSKNQKLAKDFLKWHHQKENYEKWFQVNEGYSVGSTKVWEDNAMWSKVDKPLRVFQRAAGKTRSFGYAGPATAKATEVYTKYIIVDMYAKAVQGMKAEDAVKWADGELKKIYG
jgi:multiple sugar transport system substrate-binding protein